MISLSCLPSVSVCECAFTCKDLHHICHLVSGASDISLVCVCECAFTCKDFHHICHLVSGAVDISPVSPLCLPVSVPLHMKILTIFSTWLAVLVISLFLCLPPLVIFLSPSLCLPVNVPLHVKIFTTFVTWLEVLVISLSPSLCLSLAHSQFLPYSRWLVDTGQSYIFRLALLQEWPIMGGKNLAKEPASKDLLITGYGVSSCCMYIVIVFFDESMVEERSSKE